MCRSGQQLEAHSALLSSHMCLKVLAPKLVPCIELAPTLKLAPKLGLMPFLGLAPKLGLAPFLRMAPKLALAPFLRPAPRLGLVLAPALLHCLHRMIMDSLHVVMQSVIHE